MIRYDHQVSVCKLRTGWMGLLYYQTVHQFFREGVIYIGANQTKRDTVLWECWIIPQGRFAFWIQQEKWVLLIQVSMATSK